MNGTGAGGGPAYRRSRTRPHDEDGSATGPTFHLFAYGTLRRAGPASALLDGCTFVGEAETTGTLYDIKGEYPALMLYGQDTIHGEIWRCPTSRLAELDTWERVDDGLFRRVGIEIDSLPCWIYVAGPRLARRLTPAARLPGGEWLPEQTPDRTPPQPSAR
ncbi:MAG TPA: gamma-glutamylcyclotransferase family protein [Planctomycetaceae bacterium]|nr:gamma-glutamylcyclotransferase family protein [Planctomycetaceae bacterium]